VTANVEHEPKLLFPGLKSFYDIAVPLAWPIVGVGWNLLMHGWGKVVRGPSAYIRGFVEQGFDPALPWVWTALRDTNADAARVSAISRRTATAS